MSDAAAPPRPPRSSRLDPTLRRRLVARFAGKADGYIEPIEVLDRLAFDYAGKAARNRSLSRMIRIEGRTHVRGSWWRRLCVQEAWQYRGWAHADARSAARLAATVAVWAAEVEALLEEPV